MRLIAAFSLVLVIVGAFWCVDGCQDPSAAGSTSTPSASVCTICVVPFAVTPRFDLPHDAHAVTVEPAQLTAKLISVPPLGIDHPPRAL